jgi:DNA-binding transcriptional LysR family regulator
MKIYAALGDDGRHNVELKWLQDFLELVETRSFSTAAQRRHVTQPAFSRRIRALEDWAGVALFDRDTTPLQLTPSGKAFESVACEITKKLLDSRERMQLYEKIAQNSIAIATSHTLSTYYFAKWFSALGPAFTDLAVRVISTNGHEGMQMLRDGNCDLLMSYYHQRMPLELDPELFLHITIGNDRLVPLCATDDAGQPRYMLPGTNGKMVPYLEYSSNIVLGRAVEGILKRHPDVRLVPCYETDMVDSLKAMMLAGRGIGWLPESVAEAEISMGRLVHPATDGSASDRVAGDWDTTIELRLYRPIAPQSPRVEQLWEFLNV